MTTPSSRFVQPTDNSDISMDWRKVSRGLENFWVFTNDGVNHIVLNRRDKDSPATLALQSQDILPIYALYNLTSIEGLEDVEAIESTSELASDFGDSFTGARYGPRNVSFNGVVEGYNLAAFRELQGRLHTFMMPNYSSSIVQSRPFEVQTFWNVDLRPIAFAAIPGNLTGSFASTGVNGLPLMGGAGHMIGLDMEDMNLGNGRYYAEFSIRLRMMDPRLYYPFSSINNYAASHPDYYQVINPGGSANLRNDGNVAVHARMRFGDFFDVNLGLGINQAWSTSGDVVIQNTTTGQSMTLNGPLSKGAGIFYDILSQQRWIRLSGESTSIVVPTGGANANTLLDYTQDGDPWILLQPGDNQIELTATAATGSPRLTIDKVHAWV